MHIDANKTVYISFPPPNFPHKFELIRVDNKKEELEFERYLNGKTPRIKFNVPIAGNFITNVPVKIEKIVPIEIKDLSIELPPFERNRVNGVDIIQIIKNTNLDNTPARIHTGTGVIELGSKMYNYPKPMRVFFILHELGHFYYGLTEENFNLAKELGEIAGKRYLEKKHTDSEKYCDLFALIFFLKMGYNMSTAMYCLTNVLRRNPVNMKRILFIYNKLMQ